jgi:hypothetical protein
MLGENAAQAAPPAVMMELGKIALVGAPAASAGVSTAHVVTTSLLAGIKAKVVVVTAVAVIGAGSVVTYQHAARSRSSENTVVTRSPVPRVSSRTISRPSSVASAPAPRAPAATASSAAVQRWNELIGAGRPQAGGRGSQKAASQEPTAPTEDPTSAIETYGMATMGAGSASGSTPPQNAAIGVGGGMMFMGAGSTPPGRDPNAPPVRMPDNP